MSTWFNAEYNSTHMANSNKLNALSTWAFFIYTAQIFMTLLPLFALHSFPALYGIIKWECGYICVLNVQT